MKRSSLVIVCSLACGIAWGAGSVHAQTGHPVSKKEVVTTKTSTAAFVPRAQIADQFEIEASKIAVQRAQKVDVKQFAQKMVDDHSRAAAKFKMAAEKSGLKAAPVGLDTEHLNKLEQLRTASVSAFDRIYVTMQVEAHEKALALHRGYATSGDKAPLKAAAQEAVPMVQHHLQEARSLSSSIGAES